MQEDFLQFLRAEGADLGRRNFVLLDEIQYLRDPSKFIKLIVDHHSDKVKLVVTGFSALGIKMKFRDSLVGKRLLNRPRSIFWITVYATICLVTSHGRSRGGIWGSCSRIWYTLAL